MKTMNSFIFCWKKNACRFLTFRYSQTEFWFISACFAWNADTMLATLQRLWLCAEALLLCSQTASGHRVRHKQSYCTSYAPASSNLIFWSHGFHGNRAIVLTGNEEDCISSWGLVRYTTACVHTHTHARARVGMWSLWCNSMWYWSCVMGKRWQTAANGTFQEHQMSGECWLTFGKLSSACGVRRELWLHTLINLEWKKREI